MYNNSNNNNKPQYQKKPTSLENPSLNRNYRRKSNIVKRPNNNNNIAKPQSNLSTMINVDVDEIKKNIDKLNQSISENFTKRKVVKLPEKPMGSKIMVPVKEDRCIDSDVEKFIEAANNYLQIKEDNEEVIDIEKYKEILSRFIADCRSTVSQPQSLYNVIEDEFLSVAKIISHYYDPRYRELEPEFNIIFIIMQSQLFANTLYEVCKGNKFNPLDVDNRGETICKSISILLKLVNNELNDITYDTYMYKIVGNLGMYGDEIEYVVSNFGLSDTLATLLIVATLTKPDDMTSTQEMYSFSNEFIDTILSYCDEDMEVLNFETVKGLFECLIGNFKEGEGRNISRLLTYIGIMLVREFDKFSDEVQNCIYLEYVLTLYKLLDECTDQQINQVLDFINSHLVSVTENKIEDVKLYKLVFNEEILKPNKALYENIVRCLTTTDNSFLKFYMNL